MTTIDLISQIDRQLNLGSLDSDLAQLLISARNCILDLENRCDHLAIVEHVDPSVLDI